MRTLMGSMIVGRRLTGMLLLCSLALTSVQAAQAGATLEIVEFSKPGEKKTVPLNSEEPVLFNIEYFSGWSHCEVAAGFKSSTRQSYAWLRCFSLDVAQIALTCLGNERQTVVMGDKDESNKERGSLALVCSNND